MDSHRICEVMSRASDREESSGKMEWSVQSPKAAKRLESF